MGNPTSGWTSLMAVILFLGGIQLLTIGILGKYISKIYLETKRPLYLIKEKSDLPILTEKIERKDYNFTWKYAKLEGVDYRH